MKKNLLFIIFILIGCSSDSLITEKISCPTVLFSSEHRNYIASNEDQISLDNLSYKATINNYKFESDCELVNNFLEINLSILFIVKPENSIQTKNIDLPYYVTFLNDNKVIDTQYFQLQGEFNKNNELTEYVETELVDIIEFKIDKNILNSNFKNQILIGFMLDNKKLMLLN